MHGNIFDKQNINLNITISSTLLGELIVSNYYILFFYVSLEYLGLSVSGHLNKTATGLLLET